MGFLSFHEKYYRQELLKLENRSLSAEEVYAAKQLLKVLDDLADEGYTSLNDHLEGGFSCLSRLRSVIRRAGETPFEMAYDRLPKTTYGVGEYALASLMERLSQQANAQAFYSENPFLQNIRAYCKWIGYDNDTAYIFLFRDTLLPYLYYQNRGRTHLYAWLISRRFLQKETCAEGVDDEIRLAIYEALENGYTDFGEYHAFCRERMTAVLEKYKALRDVLCRLLASVTEERIVVIESGYCGTIPMLLSALDNRVTFRLYTTAPFLYDTYRDNVFCTRYEDIRRFETLYSQDLLLRYAAVRDNRFYVQMSESEMVLRQALGEMKAMIDG